MRLMTATLVLLAAALLGSSRPDLSAQTDTAPAGVRVGDTVEVTFPAEITGALFKCTIAGSRDGFVRCKEEESRTSPRSGPVTWHNLRLAWQVRVLPRDEFAIR